MRRTGLPARQFKSMSYKDGKYGVHKVTQTELDKTIEKIKGLRLEAAVRTGRAIAELHAKVSE